MPQSTGSAPSMGQVYAGTVPLPSLGADMRRREFIGLIGGAVALRPAAPRAQQTPIVGILYSGSSEAFSGEFPAFRRGLSETGFLEGRNIAFEVRTADSHMDRLAEMGNDLVRRRVSVIFSGGNTGATLAAKTATTTIPIVFFLGTDPVGLGIVASLAAPAETSPVLPSSRQSCSESVSDCCVKSCRARQRSATCATRPILLLPKAY